MSNEFSISEIIIQLSDGIREAYEANKDKTSVLKLTSCEVELLVGATKTKKGEVKFSLWNIGASGGAEGSREKTSKIMLKFDPTGVANQFVQKGTGGAGPDIPRKQ